MDRIMKKVVKKVEKDMLSKASVTYKRDGSEFIIEMVYSGENPISNQLLRKVFCDSLKIHDKDARFY